MGGAIKNLYINYFQKKKKKYFRNNGEFFLFTKDSGSYNQGLRYELLFYLVLIFGTNFQGLLTEDFS